MRYGWKQLWRVLKFILALAILIAVGLQFARDLKHEDLWQQTFKPAWLVCAGILYIFGLGFSAGFWFRLLGQLGQKPSCLAAFRAYYVSQLGKYVPGKAWAVLLRAGLVRSPGVSAGVAALSTIYEVLTTMAAGTLLATVLFALQTGATPSSPSFPPVAGERGGAGENGYSGSTWENLWRLLINQDLNAFRPDRTMLVLLALVLFLPVFLPLVPPVFNRLVYHIAFPFRGETSTGPPCVNLKALMTGLALTSFSWVLFAISLWAMFQGVLEHPPAWSWDACGRYISYLGVAYVAGFVSSIPGGLGVREFLLTLFLVRELGEALPADEVQARVVVKLIVVDLRLVWTAAELLLASTLYLLPGRGLVRSK